MRIITWNCNMAFRRKAGHILGLEPDIVVVPECECIDKLKFPTETKKPTSILWFGKNVNKGLGIFSYGDTKLKLLKMHNPDLRMVVPVSVKSTRYQFILYAIWAFNPDDPDGTYVEQVWKAIHYYEAHLKKKSTMLIGDFNSNTIWDKQYRQGNHSHVVEFLGQKRFTAPIIYTTTSGREKKSIRLCTCTATKTNLITLIIALSRKTWQKTFIQSRSVILRNGPSIVTMCP